MPEGRMQLFLKRMTKHHNDEFMANMRVRMEKQRRLAMPKRNRL